MDQHRTEPFNLNLSAPGKIILFGEYSVVFNKPAVAGTLCLRTHLNLSESMDDSVHLQFSAMDIDRKFCLSDIRQDDRLSATEPTDDNWREYVERLGELVGKVGSDLSQSQKNSLLVFFHCFRKCLRSSRGFRLGVRSDLPVGSGVGSSASFSVVVAASALMYGSHLGGTAVDSLLSKRPGNVFAVSDEDFRRRISEMAYSCEKIFHGSPSGVDNTTVLHGTMLEFVKSPNGGSPHMQTIDTGPVNVLLVNTNIPRSTKSLVEGVRQLRRNHPDVIDNVLAAMEGVARSAIKILPNLNKSGDGSVETLEDRFGELITLNHNLLRVLGVSHPALENIVSIAQKYNLPAKLTGAGGGGFAFVYLPSRVDASTVEDTKRELTAAGYTVSSVYLGAPGLTVEDVRGVRS